MLIFYTSYTFPANIHSSKNSLFFLFSFQRVVLLYFLIVIKLWFFTSFCFFFFLYVGGGDEIWNGCAILYFMVTIHYFLSFSRTLVSYGYSRGWAVWLHNICISIVYRRYPTHEELFLTIMFEDAIYQFSSGVLIIYFTNNKLSVILNI